MKLKFWGTRGSIAISNPESVVAGGNTTCFEVMSECIPQSTRLMVDAGTGFVPAGRKYLSEIGNGLRYVLLFTHYHYDHVMGLTLAPPTFIDQVPMELYGPVDNDTGPKEMIEKLFERPFFPVDSKRIMHKMNFKSLADFDVHVILVHPKGGFATMALDRYKGFLGGKRHVPINSNGYPLNECMVIKMAKANHGNANCISYRFEENPTGKVFVLCTDHEDSVSISLDMRSHLAAADLLIIDAQYDHNRYLTMTGGFGHGTPTGCVKNAVACGVKRVGFTHHDPTSTDQVVEKTILVEGQEALAKNGNWADLLKIYNVGSIKVTPEDIFICHDYQETEV